MLQGQRVILEGGMQVSHCRVAGVAGLGHQAKVGQLQCPHQFQAHIMAGRITALRLPGAHCQRDQEGEAETDNGQVNGSRTQGLT